MWIHQDKIINHALQYYKEFPSKRISNLKERMALLAASTRRFRAVQQRPTESILRCHGPVHDRPQDTDPLVPLIRPIRRQYEISTGRLDGENKAASTATRRRCYDRSTVPRRSSFMNRIAIWRVAYKNLSLWIWILKNSFKIKFNLIGLKLSI